MATSPRFLIIRFECIVGPRKTSLAATGCRRSQQRWISSSSAPTSAAFLAWTSCHCEEGKKAAEKPPPRSLAPHPLLTKHLEQPAAQVRLMLVIPLVELFQLKCVADRESINSCETLVLSTVVDRSKAKLQSSRAGLLWCRSGDRAIPLCS